MSAWLRCTYNFKRCEQNCIVKLLTPWSMFWCGSFDYDTEMHYCTQGNIGLILFLPLLPTLSAGKFETW